MKRLALLLGSLLVVSAAASAKEVVPAPVVVEEAPVQVVEKEVIVYRDKEEGFRPNGTVSAEYRYYGKTEDQLNVKKDGAWNKNNRYSRLQLQTNINFAENQTLDIRSRSYQSLANEDRENYNGKSDEVRVQYYYNHGLLGDTKVGGTSFVEYINAGEQSIQYRYDFQLADYLFDNDFIKTTNFVVGPKLKYTWGDSNSSDYKYTVGLYFDWINQLPFGFSTEIEIDGAEYTSYGKEQPNNYGKKYDDSLDLTVKALLLHDMTLYTADKLSVNWHAEAGYDTYSTSNRTTVGHAKVNGVANEWEYSSYYAKVAADLTANYKATEFVNLFAGIGAEYGNWTVSAEENATNWRWQPYAFAGFNVSF